MANFQLTSTAISATQHKFIHEFELTDKQHILTLPTENTFVDQDIELKFTVQDGEVTNNANINVTPYIKSVTTSGTSYYVVSVSAVNSVAPIISSAGFVNTSGTQAIAGDIKVSGNMNMLQSVISSTSITPLVSAATTATIGAGYYPTDRYIVIKGMNSGQAANITSDKCNYNAPHVNISGTTNLKTSTVATNYQFTRTGSVENGQFQTKFTVTTAGYAAIQDTINNTIETITPTKTEDKTIYIVESSLSTTVTGGIINNSINTTQTKGIDIKSSSNSNNGIVIGIDLSASKVGIKSMITEGYTTTASLSTTYSCATSLAKYYVDGITLGKPSTGTTATFYLTFPNGANDTMTFNFTIDSSGNVTIS